MAANALDHNFTNVKGSTTALNVPQGAVNVPMSMGDDSLNVVRLPAGGTGLSTQNLTSCIAVATFCHCNRQLPLYTLTHVAGVSKALGQYLGSSGYVHDNDMIVIGFGDSALEAHHQNEFLRAKRELKEGLAVHQVATITWAKDFIKKPSALDAHSFIVQANGTYGRAAAARPVGGAGAPTASRNAGAAPAQAAQQGGPHTGQGAKQNVGAPRAKGP